jgi:hypothetical protein
MSASSPFNECLILATICGRSLLHDHQDKVSKAYGDLGSEWEQQRQWLDHILTTRLEALSERYPSPIEAHDPLLLFANILSQATVVYHCKGITESTANCSTLENSNSGYLEIQSRAVAAIKNIVSLAKAMSELHFSKVSYTKTSHLGLYQHPYPDSPLDANSIIHLCRISLRQLF